MNLIDTQETDRTTLSTDSYLYEKTPEKQPQPEVRFSMQAKLTLGILGIALIAMGVIAFAIISTTRIALIEAANQNLLGTANQISTEIDAYLEANIKSLQAEAQIPILQEYALYPSRRSGYKTQIVRDSLTSLQSKDPYILSYSLLDINGEVIADTRTVRKLPAFLDADAQTKREFESAMNLGQTYISPLKFEEDAALVYFAATIKEETGNTAGLLVARYDSDVFQHLIDQNTELAGPGSYGVLYGQIYDNYIHIAHGNSPELFAKSLVPYSANRLETLKENRLLPDIPAEEISLNLPSLITNIEDAFREPYFTYSQGNFTNQVAIVQLEEKPWFLAFYQPQDTFLSPVAQQTTLALLLAILVGGFMSLAAYFAAQNYTSPLIHLAEIAQKVGQGDLEARAEVKTKDELGVLAKTFNTTTSQLQHILETLEQQVVERTKGLAQRAVQLQTASEVARDVTTIRDQETLLTRVAQLISERFGFYHTGIFLIVGDQAVLQATNSAGGQRMLARGHRLKVGETGIVGYTAKAGEARIALDVGEDAVFFDNPDLPQTRSEIALPLILENRVIGVLDVQSKKQGAFSQEDIEILQVLADQIAVALDNARLLEQSQKTLEEIEELYGEQVTTSWKRHLKTHPQLYRYVSGIVSPLDSLVDDQKPQIMTSDKIIQKSHELLVPIKIRNKQVGTISLSRDPEKPSWTEDDLELLRETVEQTQTVLETTRLYEEAQRQAAEERMTTHITSSMRETLNIDTIIQTAAEEIRQGFALPEVIVQLIPPEKNSSSEENKA